MAFAAICGGCSQQPASTNPLLSDYTTPYQIPPFESITIDNYREAFLKGIAEQRDELNAIAGNSEAPTFENTIIALENSGQLLMKAQRAFGAISGSNSTDETRALQREIQPITSAFSDSIYLNEELFQRIKKLHDDQASLGLDKEQAKLLDNYYQRFVRNGADLSGDAKAKLTEINAQISDLQLQFGQNLIHDTNNDYVIVDNVEELAGLPQRNIDAAAQMAKDNGQEGKYFFNMQRASCNPVLQYCSNRDLRKKIYDAYYNRGNHGNEYDNNEIANKLVALRLEKAKLFGFDNYAQYALQSRMAKTPENVYNLLNQIWEPAVKKAQEEIADIRAEIKKEGNNFEPEGWDYSYYLNKAKQAKFNIEEGELRQYLAEDNVIQGIFYVANKLYGLTFKERTDLPKYEPTVRSYEVYDKNDSLLAIFYNDYYPRAGKGAGAWCSSFRGTYYENGKRVIPQVVNVASLASPSGDTPALERIDDVVTMFHEFGHALHNFMIDVHYRGTSRVEQDFVEVPSQLNEHWAFQPEVLNVYAKHYQTGETIPVELVQKVQESGKYGMGFDTTELLAAMLVDMDLHTLTEIPEGFNCMDYETQKLAERGIPKQILPRYRVTNFQHIMSGGYTAGYYSYLWSEVYECDAFQAYEEAGNIFDQDIATRWRNTIFAPGGIDEGMVMYRNFRGRDPKVDGLLETRGLK